MKKIRIVGIASVILVVGIVALNFNNNRIEHINDQLATNPPAAGDGRSFGDIERARSRINDTTAGFHTKPASLSVYKEIEGNVTSFSDIPTRNYSASTGRGEIIQVNASNPPTKPKPDVNQQVKHSKWESQFAMFPQDKDGWSIITPAVDSRMIYVSNTDGNDSKAKAYFSKDIDDPHNPPANVVAFKTIGAALRLQRNGYSDWILLKKGDEWTNGTIYLPSGRSSAEPLVISSYGTSQKRPLIKTGVDSGIVLKSGMDFIAIVGINFYANKRDPSSREFVGWNNIKKPTGFSSVVGNKQPVNSINLEDNIFNFYSGNVAFSGNSEQKNIVVRRNQILNSYSVASHSQGIYANMTSMLFEENLVDHNGWYQQNYANMNDRAKGQATYFNHNMYLGDSQNMVIVGNTITRASSIGIKFAANGIINTKKNNIAAENIIVKDNLFAEGEIGISAGGNKDYANGYRFKNMKIIDNVMIHIGESQPLRRTLALHMHAIDWDDGQISHNYFIYNDNMNVTNVHGIDVQGLIRDVNISDNVFKGLGINTTNIVNRFDDEGTKHLKLDNNVIANKDPRRDLNSYLSSSLTTNGVESLVLKLKSQSKNNWNKNYTAIEINKYLMQ